MVFLLPKKSFIKETFPLILLAAIIPSFTAVGQIGFLPLISPAAYTSFASVSPFSLIITPNLSQATDVPSKNLIFDLTPVQAITSSQGTSSPVLSLIATGFLFSSTISFSAFTPNFKFTPLSANNFSYLFAEYLSN